MAKHPPSGECYEYQPLAAEGWTRILELHPGSGALACTISSKSITNAVLSFEALSYVWGNDAQTNTFRIDCNGRTLSIGANLKSALMRLRHDKQPRLLWVDAVCINQNDDEEKSQQVKHMGEIYASAKVVLIWMGEDLAGEAEDCFALIKETNTFLMEQLAKCNNVTDIPFIAHGNGSMCVETAKWDTVRHLMDSEWFTRVWVLQEVGLARAAVILWGKSTMNWSQLVEFMLFVAWRVDVGAHTGNVKSGTIYDVYEDVWRSFENKDTWRDELPLTRSMNQTAEGQTLIEILNDGRAYQATDQRDRIYAFLSHPRASSHAKKKAAIVDYRKSVDEVYAETARHILEHDLHPWTVLSCIDHPPDSPSLSGQRPSWVPRWDEGFRVYWLGYSSMWYRAGGDQPSAFQVKITSDSFLETSAVILDTIAWTSKPFVSEELSLTQQKKATRLQKLWQEVEQIESSPLTKSSGHDCEYAFSLAVAAGRAADEGAAQDNATHHWAVYQTYKQLLAGDDANDTQPVDRVSSNSEPPEESLHLEALTYINNQRRALHNRRLFRTRQGRYGVGHRTLEMGDLCCVIRSANVPFVLRKADSLSRSSDPRPETGNTYRMVGEAYIQGIMKGEVLDMLDGGSVVEANILLV